MATPKYYVVAKAMTYRSTQTFMRVVYPARV